MTLVTILVLNLLEIAQSIPMPAHLIINVVVVGNVWFQFRKFRTDFKARTIINHTGLLLLVWIVMSIFVGLFFTFAILESGGHGSLLDGVLYGIRIAALLTPAGIVAFSAPVIRLLSVRTPVRS